jgi:hypothetical protein
MKVPPNLLSYDDGLHARLVTELLKTILAVSTTDGVVCLRMHEIRNAIADTFAEILALEGTIPDRRLVDSHAQRVRRLLAHHRKNPSVAKFKTRTIRVDVGKKGRAS